MKVIGLILIVIGITMIGITGFTYVTQTNVVDLGAIQVNKEVSHPVNWSPVAGGIILVGGLVLLITQRKK
jgi:membrane-bound ClpP family serine protease